ncbi:protein phosphatase 2C domain-containing protein [Leptolyngbya sp. BC1307]|uniref:PP2C family protein-serine/threonine phosphatase n=1 Tax=Leptolyngbya sp. BC1307 TaxID=2029589 RepID=UPI00114100E0|nr:protein phosphatase 2C domain-containing protein [Leptolyngbya sp. BC1307]
MINCPNPSCKTANPEGAHVCQGCRSVLPYHYLWGVGELVSTLRPGAMINQRYLLKQDRTFLDTQPGLIPESLPELPDFLLPYLHLSAYPLHVPRPYAVLRSPDDDDVLMLESAALATPFRTDGQIASVPELLPKLVTQWPEAPPLRQLSWLWQVAQLWDAMQAEQVAPTLLDESLLRVDGSVLRLLELAPPTASGGAAVEPTLMNLGHSWLPLVQTASPAIRAFLQRLCEGLERQLFTAEQLADQLSQAIALCGQNQAVSYDLAVYTDQGPTRKRNEDACYPASGSTQSLTSEQTRITPQLLIVCDGIGGHQGGDVASKLAIATIEAQLQPILTASPDDMSATELLLAIEEAICAANDEISAQNDQAQRQARDRMGTTLVLALVRGTEVYIAHVGDSRAYRISQQNCQQVTLDDDVASRQVRLGGSLYREVLLQPGSGSLIQALGMGSSQVLRPTVQRFVLDQTCVFLLCSDGLSDGDRVEQFWQSAILPLITDGSPTAEAGQHLVDLANKYNGHDNVTVGLLTARVTRDSDQIVPRELASPVAADARPTAQTTRRHTGLLAANPGATSQAAPSTPLMTAATAKSEKSAAAKPSFVRTGGVKTGGVKTAAQSGWKVASLAILLLAAVGGVLYWLLPGLSWRLQPSVADLPDGDNSSEVRPAPSPAPATQPPAANLQVGSYARIRQSDVPGITSSNGGNNGLSSGGFSPLTLYPSPVAAGGAAVNVIPGTIPTGGIVRVIGRQTADDQSQWVQLKLCSIPSGETLAEVPAETDTPNPAASGSTTLNPPESIQTDRPLVLSPGSEGWVVASQVALVSETIQDLQPTQKGSCGG